MCYIVNVILCILFIYEARKHAHSLFELVDPTLVNL